MAWFVVALVPTCCELGFRGTERGASDEKAGFARDRRDAVLTRFDISIAELAKPL